MNKTVQQHPRFWSKYFEDASSLSALGDSWILTWLIHSWNSTLEISWFLVFPEGIMYLWMFTPPASIRIGLVFFTKNQKAISVKFQDQVKIQLPFAEDREWFLQNILLKKFKCCWTVWEIILATFLFFFFGHLHIEPSTDHSPESWHLIHLNSTASPNP